ncbi:DUF262 domain-containing HNH endonuclease family protein [Micrococcus lylae]|uniref:DUF262 domain-containing HNH endonuclease family protein n=1 Tax=Micrococcus lylae TaxID=1273 RepID=UPI0021A60A30|nr:DUF262 domain-containing HNH endonuclease family protein [Micrococcus lylae]MCT2006811.1 DUF262 domain-containing HNH endonuclease family protein [Micrococcus lylae]MCT2070631.1 DUF262 domain-containing HNH endonuclease family protein [Micrococcus lylae]
MTESVTTGQVSIEAIRRTLEEILNLGQHHIPRYQRRYAWELQNINEFWSDIINAESPHFLGTMVVASLDTNRFEVVDGQQRLTTALIALAAIRDILEFDLRDHGRAEGVAGYIEFKSRRGEPKSRIVNDDDHARNRLLDDALHRKTPAPTVPSEDDSAELHAYVRFRELVLEGDYSVEERTQWLDRVVDKILETNIVYVRVPDRQSAFTVFETLNDRGKSLNSVDLVKNLIFSGIPETVSRDAERIWSDTMHRIDSLTLEGVDEEAVLYYFWNSRGSGVGERLDPVEQHRIRREMTDLVKSSPSGVEICKELLEDFSFSSQVFRVFDSLLKSRGAESALRDFVEEFNLEWRPSKFSEISAPLYGILITRANQPYPTLLSAARAYKDKRMKSVQLIRLLKAVEKFQFRWSIAKKGSTSTVRRLYRRTALAIHSSSSRSVAKHIDEFISSANNMIPTDKQFSDGLQKIDYSKTRGKEGHKIRYIFQRLEQYWGDTNLDFSRPLSIEHIEPQGRRSEVTPQNYWVFRIGNMTLLPESVNAGLPDQFPAKCAELRNWVNSKDSVLRAAINRGSWGNSDYRERSQKICDAAIEIWPEKI